MMYMCYVTSVIICYIFVILVLSIIKKRRKRLCFVSKMKVEEVKTNPGSSNPRPAPRSGHRITCHNGCLYAFGGYSTRNSSQDSSDGCLFSELWCLNLSSRQWTELSCTGAIPHEVASHTMARQNNTLVVFGGTAKPFGELCSNTVSLCNIEQKDWRVVTTTGEKPQKLYGQASRLTDGYFYVMGGTSGMEYFNDIHRLDLKTGTWEKLGKLLEGPSRRYRHEIAVYNDRVFVIGGGTATACHSLRKIAVFCLASQRWTFTRTECDDIHGHPPPRKCHSAVQREHVLYVSGGLGRRGGLNDIWMLNLNNMTWSRLPIALPQPVYFHDMDMYQGCLYIFGGVIDKGQSRTNSVWKCWVQVSSLQDLCWEAILQGFPSIYDFSPNQMLQIGIPAIYVKRFFHQKLNS